MKDKSIFVFCMLLIFLVIASNIVFALTAQDFSPGGLYNLVKEKIVSLLGGTYAYGEVIAFTKLMMGILIFTLIFWTIGLMQQEIPRNIRITVSIVISLLTVFFIPLGVINIFATTYTTIFSFVIVGIPIIALAYLGHRIPNTNRWWIGLKVILFLVLFFIFSLVQKGVTNLLGGGSLTGFPGLENVPKFTPVFFIPFLYDFAGKRKLRLKPFIFIVVLVSIFPVVNAQVVDLGSYSQAVSLFASWGQVITLLLAGWHFVRFIIGGEEDRIDLDSASEVARGTGKVLGGFGGGVAGGAAAGAKGAYKGAHVGYEAARDWRNFRRAKKGLEKDTKTLLATLEKASTNLQQVKEDLKNIVKNRDRLKEEDVAKYMNALTQHIDSLIDKGSELEEEKKRYENEVSPLLAQATKLASELSQNKELGAEINKVINDPTVDHDIKNRIRSIINRVIVARSTLLEEDKGDLAKLIRSYNYFNGLEHNYIIGLRRLKELVERDRLEEAIALLEELIKIRKTMTEVLADFYSYLEFSEKNAKIIVEELSDRDDGLLDLLTRPVR